MAVTGLPSSVILLSLLIFGIKIFPIRKYLLLESFYQADGTAWMGFFSLVMLDIALNLAIEDPAYEDMASKFFEHFVMIVDAVNAIGGNTLFRKRMLSLFCEF